MTRCRDSLPPAARRLRSRRRTAQTAVYLTMFTTPNHGPDGHVSKEWSPTAHIFYSSGEAAAEVYWVAWRIRANAVAARARNASTD